MSSEKKSQPARSDSSRAPRFKVWHAPHGAHPWAVRVSNKLPMLTHKVWINALAETVSGKHGHYITGEGYVTRNDDGSISIN